MKSKCAFFLVLLFTTVLAHANPSLESNSSLPAVTADTFGLTATPVASANMISGDNTTQNSSQCNRCLQDQLRACIISGQTGILAQLCALTRCRHVGQC